MECVEVGSTNADIAGLGIILAFAIQGFISLVLSAWSFTLRDVLERIRSTAAEPLGLNHQNFAEVHKKRYKAQRVVIDQVLATAADAQTLTGIFQANRSDFAG